jgi:N-acetylneuraminic acid mutarotase
MLGFCYGNRLEDKLQYLTHGTNKQVFYKIYKSVEEIDEDAIKYILSEAIVLDQQW